MKSLLFLYIFTPLACIGQFENALLWKISREGNTHTSYLFGSLHTNDSVANTFSKSWWNAFDQCDVLASEVSTFEQLDPSAILQMAMMKDTLLKDLYSKQDYLLVTSLLEKEFEPDYLSMLQSMKPFHILAWMLEKPDGEGIQSIMDIHLQQLAMDKGKKIVGLETPLEQAASIDILTLSEQAKLLLSYAQSPDKEKEDFGHMRELYLAQKLDSLGRSGMTRELPEKLVHELVEERNKRFLERLQMAMAEARVFCVVGAMHLTGEDGMIAALKRNGYTMEPVAFSFGKVE